MNTETHQFQAEVRQLLDIVINALYSDREIFVRELVSNASDALEKLRVKQLTDSNIYQPDKPLEISITTDKDNKTITIADTGIGMTEADLVENLGTIAHSGTKKFLEALKQKQEGGTDLIGQFGVGFYSSFMVAEQVEVFTHSHEPEAASLRWVSEGREGYSIETLDEPLDRGTRIVIHLKEEYAEFSQDYRVKELLHRYSNFVAFPINFNGEHINTVQAIMATLEEDLPKYDATGYARITAEDVAWLEEQAHILEKECDIRFKGWARPGKEGSLGSAYLDLARSVCRRAERRVVALRLGNALSNINTALFLNRLSDLCWILARFEALDMKEKTEDQG